MVLSDLRDHRDKLDRKAIRELVAPPGLRAQQVLLVKLGKTALKAPLDHQDQLDQWVKKEILVLKERLDLPALLVLLDRPAQKVIRG
jgi:hypothetical protein